MRYLHAETTPEALANWRRIRGEICAVAFAAKSTLTLSEWSDRYRILSADLGEPGPWRTSRVPYLRRPMDAITDPRVRRVTIMKSARIGATQGLVVNGILYHIHQDPTPIIVGLPIDADAQKFSDKLLQPAIDDCREVAERIASDRSRARRNTILQKSFPGGGLAIIGTKSPRTMRMVHGRVIYKSEVDAWEGSAGEDGDPYRLIDRRADAYGNPKYIEESTPLVKETSRIEPAFLAGSQEYYHVPCPHCGEYQRLVWGSPGSREGHEEEDADVPTGHGLRWPRRADGSPKLDEIYYVCEHNGCEILEEQKFGMLARGEWVATHPERREHLSFHLNALLSPFQGARWPILVNEWHTAQGKPELIRIFVNTLLGETYQEEGEQADHGILEERRDQGDSWWSEETPVPAGVARLTRSVDTQDDRLEMLVVGWGAGEECWLIEHRVLPGDPATRAPWDALDAELDRRYRHASGRLLMASVTFIDAGGHRAAAVNAYARKRRNKRVFAIFGSTQERAPILGKPSENKKARTVQYPIGSFAGKETLMARLSKIHEPGPGYIHVAPDFEDEQLRQMTVEKLVVRGDSRKFIKPSGARNEMTDLWVYALAALYQLGPRTTRRLGAIAKRLMRPLPAGQPPAAAADDPDADEPPDPAPPSAPAPRRPPPAPRPPAPPIRRKNFVNGWR